MCFWLSIALCSALRYLGPSLSPGGQEEHKWTFCILGKWFRLNLRVNRLHKSKGTWQFITNLVVSGQITREKKPHFRLTSVALCLKLKLPFVRLFHTSSPLRSIELSVKTLNVRARARHSAKIKMVNGYPFHLDYTIIYGVY